MTTTKTASPYSWIDAANAVDPKIVSEYVGDPTALSRVDKRLAMLPDDDARLMVLEAFHEMNVRLDSPEASILLTTNVINAKLTGKSLFAVFSDVENIRRRSEQMGASLARLTTESSRLLGEVADRVAALDGATVAVTEQLENVGKNTTEAMDGLQRTFVAGLEAIVKQSVNDKLAEVFEATAAQADAMTTQAIEERIGGHLRSIDTRFANVDRNVANLETEVDRQVGSLKIRAVRLHPLLQRMMELAHIPDAMIAPLLIASSVSFVLGGALVFAIVR